LAAGCGGGIEGEWQIQMTYACTGKMILSGPDSALTGYWDCSNARGPVAGTRSSAGVLSLDLKSDILQYPLHVAGVHDGSSIHGTVSATNWPRHEFVANR
jgi:hypothetical protein